MLDPAKYLTLKAAGAITGITILDDTITITAKSFDPNTGEPLADSISTFSLSYFEGQIAYYQTQMDNINQIKADATA